MKRWWLALLLFPTWLTGYTPVVVPNGVTLPYEWDGDVKVFRLTAEPVQQEFTPGLVVNCWGYNGRTPGPVIEAVEGDRVRILVTNHLPEPTTVHWHGIILPNGMDGVTGLTQPPILPGETFQYEFTLQQSGTCMYHPHFDEMTQLGMGLMGFFIIHQKEETDPPDRDFCIMLQEWYIPPSGATVDPSVMLDFNYFTFNGSVYPKAEPLVAKKDQKMRIRIGNLSMDSHPIHLHGHTFWVTGTGAGAIPKSAWIPDVTVSVPVGATRDIDFVASNPGDWALHCHKTHHLMNGMGHGLPNMIGVDMSGLEDKIRKLIPGYMNMGETGMGHMYHMSHHMELPDNFAPYGAPGQFGVIDMSGMFTIVKIREDLASYDDPGWYQNPPGTVAGPVEKGERQ